MKGDIATSMYFTADWLCGFPTIAIGCQLLLLITDMKSHTCFRFLPIPITLNDLERCNIPYYAFFTEFDRFAGRLCHSGWRQTYNISKILSLSSSLLLSAKTDVMVFCICWTTPVEHVASPSTAVRQSRAVQTVVEDPSVWCLGP